VQSKAKTVKEYIEELPEDKKTAIKAVRKVILENLPKGYEETMGYGMMGYVVPLSRYPEGYLGRKDEPLPYIGLASQKNHFSLYLMNVYGDKDVEAWFKKAFQDAGKKLDMGKSCVRFRELDDLPLEVIGKVVAMTSVDELIENYKKRKGDR